MAPTNRNRPPPGSPNPAPPGAEGRDVAAVQHVASSGNVFADLGLPDADDLRARSDLAVAIGRSLARWSVSRAVAARRLGLSTGRLRDLLGGRLEGFDREGLTDVLDLAEAADREGEPSVPFEAFVDDLGRPLSEAGLPAAGLVRRLELLEGLARGEADLAAGRGHSMEEVFAEADRILGDGEEVWTNLQSNHDRAVKEIDGATKGAGATTARLLPGGRVTIPAVLRRKMGLKAGDRFAVFFREDEILLVPVSRRGKL